MMRAGCSNKGIAPHLRGKLCYVLSVTLIKRITPRTCGESEFFYHKNIWFSGSPPHLRGKLFVLFIQQKPQGITPRTCGENKSRFRLFEFLPGSPPHLRGKLSASFETRSGIGSPPHLRGKHWLGGGHVGFQRITPAPAGKTYFVYRLQTRGEDHPRTCGENN